VEESLKTVDYLKCETEEAKTPKLNKYVREENSFKSTSIEK
jgi:hypothetical protein